MTKDEYFKSKAKQDAIEYADQYVFLRNAIFESAPLKQGVHPNLLKRKGSPIDDNYLDKLKAILIYFGGKL